MAAVVPLAFVAIVVFIIVMIVLAAKRQRRRLEEFNRHAAQCGWYPVTSAVPGLVGTAARSRRARLVLGTRQGFELWLVWHRWRESNGESSTTHDLTRYFLWLGPPYPTLRLERRTSIGGFLKPVRGVGTGDAEFDKRFMVRSTTQHEALRLVTPAIRQAMLAGNLPEWAITDGVLFISYHDEPFAETLQPRTDTIIQLARTLTAETGVVGAC